MAAPQSLAPQPKPQTASASQARPAASSPRWWRGEITTRQVFFILIFLVIWLVVGRLPIKPHDFWWHLRTGQIILETGSIPTTDLFTFTRFGEPWINQAWGMQLLFFVTYRAAGLNGVLMLNMLLISGGYFFLLLACRRQTDSLIGIVAALSAAILMSMQGWTLRPQGASYLLFGMTVWILERERSGDRKILWLLPPLFALWANAHGGFLFGLGLVGLYTGARVLTDLWQVRSLWLTHPTRMLVLATLGSILALSLNPQGPLGMMDYVLGFGRSQTTLLRNIEFMALQVRESDGRFFFGITLLVAAIAYFRRMRLPWDRLLVLLVFGLAALYTRRVLLWYAMAAAPIFAPVLARHRAPRIKILPSRLRWVVMGALLFVAVVTLPPVRPYLITLDAEERNMTVDGTSTPVAALRFLCELARHDEEIRVFGEIGAAGYQIWACPDLPVFMDTRFELYPTKMWGDYLSVSAAQHGWQKRLAQYDVNALLLLKPFQGDLVQAARDVPEWELVYEDEQAVVFRSDSEVAARGP